jgi:hypothetical protein
VEHLFYFVDFFFLLLEVFFCDDMLEDELLDQFLRCLPFLRFSVEMLTQDGAAPDAQGYYCEGNGKCGVEPFFLGCQHAIGLFSFVGGQVPYEVLSLCLFNDLAPHLVSFLGVFVAFCGGAFFTLLFAWGPCLSICFGCGA